MKKTWLGLALTIGVAIVASLTQKIEILEQMHVNALILAILLGMLIRNFIPFSERFMPGIQFSYKGLLRFAVVLLGFKLSIMQVFEVGLKGILLVTILVTAAFLFTIRVGKWLGLNVESSILIGTGCSICGASAIAGIAPVIKAEERDVTFSVAAITVFGTISMILYPVIFRLFQWPELMYGVWTGASVHEVAQVVAAGFAIGDEAGKFATLVKLTRVLLLIPMILLLSVWKTKQEAGTGKNKKITVPWFVTGFILIVLLNSTGLISDASVSVINNATNFILLIAMAGLGLATSFSVVRKTGMKPIYLTLATTVFLSVVSLILVKLFYV
ncbi:YeiH family protein [Bacillus tianshenii]|nr:YeiH family protein [Bacillus tianshenii]